MLRYPGLFLSLALVAASFGYGFLAGSPAEFFKTLFFVLVALAALGCVINRTREPADSMEREMDRAGNRSPGD